MVNTHMTVYGQSFPRAALILMMIALLIVICVNFQYLYLAKYQRVANILVVHEIHEIRYYWSASTVTQFFWRIGSFKEKARILENFCSFV